MAVTVNEGAYLSGDWHQTLAGRQTRTYATSASAITALNNGTRTTLWIIYQASIINVDST